MKKIISVVGVGIAVAMGGCAQVPSEGLKSSIDELERGTFVKFMYSGHRCADELYHAKSHLSEGERVSGKFLNSGEKIIADGSVHESDAAKLCAEAEQYLSAFIDEKLAPLEARVKRLEGFHGGVVTSLQLEGVFFAFDKYNLNAESRAFLETNIYPKLESSGFPTVEVAGYTDSVGSYDYNRRLSERRAQSVADYLVSLGVPAGKLSSKGFGPDDPVASNDTDAGRAQNRRVELHIFQ
ncbi:MAG: OmpA family protein [Methylococcales bacterium]